MISTTTSTEAYRFFEQYKAAYLDYLRPLRPQLEAQYQAMTEEEKNTLKIKNTRYSLTDIVDWLETVTPATFENEESYSRMREMLDMIYSVDLFDAFQPAIQHDRYRAMAEKPGQLDKWRFIMSIRNIRAGLDFSQDDIDLHSAVAWQLSMHERGVDSTHMSKAYRLRHNPAIHSQYVDEIFDRVFKIALVLEDVNPETVAFVLESTNCREQQIALDRSAQITFSQALDIYMDRMAEQQGYAPDSPEMLAERRRILDLRRKFAIEGLVHDAGELLGELSQAGKRNVMTDSTRQAHMQQVEAAEHAAFNQELEWHAVQLAKRRAGIYPDDAAYEAVLRQHFRNVHELYLCDRVVQRGEQGLAGARQRHPDAAADDKSLYPTLDRYRRNLNLARMTLMEERALTDAPAGNARYRAARARLDPAVQSIHDHYYAFETEGTYDHAFAKTNEHSQSHKDYMGFRNRMPHPDAAEGRPQDVLGLREYIGKATGFRRGDRPAEGYPSATHRGSFPLYVIEDETYGHFKFNYVFGPARKFPNAIADEPDPVLRRLQAASFIYGARAIQKYNRPGSFLPDAYLFNADTIDHWQIDGETMPHSDHVDPKTAQVFGLDRESRVVHGRKVVTVCREDVGSWAERIAQNAMEQALNGQKDKVGR